MSDPTPLDPLRPLALELRHLRLVVAIEEERGITRAGERLHLTQPALSHQLKEIENRLGVQLFLRIKKRLVLTDAGRELLAVARRLLAEVVALEDDLRQRGAGRRGTLRVTTECYTCYPWLPQLLPRFERQHPQVDVRIVVEATSRPLAALREGSVDLALVTGGDGDDGIALQPLFEDELLLATAADHRLAARRFVRPADLAGERLLLYSSPESNLFFRQFLAGSGTTPREVVPVQLTEAIVAMVRAGLGVSPLAGWALAPELRRGGLAGVRVGERGLMRTWSAATRRAAAPPAYWEDFGHLVAAHAAPSRFAARQAAAGGG